jgi:hypothetical protein
MEKTYPLYGKHSDPSLSPEEWWTMLIRHCLVNGGADSSAAERAMGSLGPRLLERFESKEGYVEFADTFNTRESFTLVVSS